MKKLETASHCAVLVVALLACYVLVKQFILPPYTHQSLATKETAQQLEPLKGKELKISGVDWRRPEPTLVMALATYCHFCVESTSFYQRLSDLNRSHAIKARIVAAFPQDTKQGQEFTARYHLNPDQIISTPLDELGVAGTPTLLLVGADGKVERQWIGKLSSDQEQAVIQVLHN